MNSEHPPHQSSDEGASNTPETPEQIFDDNLSEDELVAEEHRNILKEEQRIADLRKSEKSIKQHDQTATTNSSPTLMFMQSTVGKVVIGGVIVTGIAAGAAIAFSGDNTPPEEAPTSAVEAPTQTMTEIVQARIDARPEPGSPEYYDQFSEMEIPYIEGQSHSEVIDSYIKSLDIYDSLGYEDAPKTFDEQTQWAIDNSIPGRQDTLYSIVDNLELDYFQEGAGLALFGADGQNSEYARVVLGRLLVQKRDNLSVILAGLKQPDETASKVSETILAENETNIVATYIGYSSTASADKPNYNTGFHLQVFEDSNGKKTWVLIGDSSSRF